MIPRATVYHSLWFDLKFFLKAILRKAANSSGIKSPLVEQFESRFAAYVNAKHAIAFPLARTALYYTLKVQNLPAGTEIIMPPLTIKPMMDVVLALKLKPVFVDLDPKTCCFDQSQLDQAINSNTGAIFITYLFGHVPEIEKLIATCKQNNLFIIEDFSQALNAEYKGKKLGTFGDVGIYSSSATKQLDCFGGGIAVTESDATCKSLNAMTSQLCHATNKSVREKIKRSLIWNLAMRRLPFTFAVNPLLTAIGRFNPEKAAKLMGARQNLKQDKILPKEYFVKFHDLQAEAGIELLNKVKPADDHRIKNARILKQGIMEAGFETTAPSSFGTSTYWQTLVFVEDTTKFVREMKRCGFDTGYTNLSLLSELDAYPEYKIELPGAIKVKYHGMFVPSHPRVRHSEAKNLCARFKIFASGI
ncbi:DegT/DnrJ/EryC1/StrS aminotransferase family protein [Rhodopirellula sp.]|nr:DegT/DnrJ/EryC1/StrS aminotransferase family protein [Rhodopirellula sp.]